jgi:exonuclease III
MEDDNPTPEANAAPWLHGDRVEVSGYDVRSSRRHWNGRQAVLHRRAKQDAWNVRLEDNKNRTRMEVDIPLKHLTMMRRRGWMAGDRVTTGGAEMRLLIGPFNPNEETNHAPSPHWTAQLETGEEIQVAEDGMQRSEVANHRRGETRYKKGRTEAECAAGQRATAVTRAIQQAHRIRGTWDADDLREEIDGQERKLDMSAAELRQGMRTARHRWETGAASFNLFSLNHGGILVRLRETITHIEKLRREARSASLDISDQALMWQADGNLYRTLKSAKDAASVIMIQETHLHKESKRANTLRGLLTTGEFEGWQLIEAPASTKGEWAGCVIACDTKECAITHETVLEEGHLMRAILHVYADGTEADLGNCYMPTNRRGSETIKQAMLTTSTRKALDKMACDAEEAGRPLMIAGDMQAQTERAREVLGGDITAYDTWLAEFTAKWGLVSSGEVEATYWAVGPGGRKVQTAIDHWLVSEELADRVEVETGPGANGMGMQTVGTQTQVPEEDRRGDAKGHNSLLLKLRLDTRAAEGDDADEG